MPELRGYQRDAVRTILSERRVLLANPPGTGKTATVLSALDGRALIVAPVPVIHHWQAEANRWGGTEAIVGTGTKPKREIARACSRRIGCHLVISYESMRNDLDYLAAQQWDWVVFDEAHRLKGRHKVQVFKAAQRLVSAPGLVLVTGTPILNSADELWAALHLLDPKTYRSFWRWADLHFVMKYERHCGRLVRTPEKLKPGHGKLLRAELGDKLIQQPLELLLPDLPPVTETDLVLTLSPAEQRHHDDLLKQAWTELPDGSVLEVQNAVSRSTRLRQLTSDWTVFGAEKPGTKIKAAIELLDDLAPEQVLVFTSFRQTADLLAAQVGWSAKPYHGGMNVLQRAQAIDAFRDGSARVLVGTIRSIGEGVDGLQVARNVIFLDRDWTPARNEQAIFRLRRMGQLRAVNVYHLIAENTIDEAVSDALARKSSVVAAVLGYRH